MILGRKCHDMNGSFLAKNKLSHFNYEFVRKAENKKTYKKSWLLTIQFFSNKGEVNRKR